MPRNPLMDFVGFQEKVQGEASQYEHQGIAGAPQAALQGAGAMQKLIGNSIMMAGERLKQEQYRQEIENYGAELGIRQSLAQTRLMEAETRRRIAEIREYEAETDRKNRPVFSARGLMGQWLPTSEGKAMQWLPAQNERGYEVLHSTDPEHIGLAKQGSWRRTLYGHQKTREEDPLAAARVYSQLGDPITDTQILEGKDAEGKPFPESMRRPARERQALRDRLLEKAMGGEPKRNGPSAPRAPGATKAKVQWPELRARYPELSDQTWAKVASRFPSEIEARAFLESGVGRRWRSKKGK